MKTWISEAAGGPDTLALVERPAPVPRDGELLMRIHAVGVNFPDSLLLRDRYQVKPPRPLTPGSEFCGTVERCGAGVVGFKVGDLVIGRCGWGAMAERFAVTQDRCARIHPTLPRIEAAGFMFAYATAYHALHDRARLKPGETLLVLGAAGGVGTAAVEIGKAMGATVRACASSGAKLAHAVARGADGGLVYDANLEAGAGQRRLAGELKALAPAGADVVFDPVGGAYAEPALRALALGGRYLVVGFTAGIPSVPLNLALLRSSQIIGVDWRTFSNQSASANTSNVDTLLAWWEQGRIAPRVTEVFRFEDAPAAIARLELREAVGKIVVEVAP
jgi:NADPH2:quinone reductase